MYALTDSQSTQTLDSESAVKRKESLGFKELVISKDKYCLSRLLGTQ